MPRANGTPTTRELKDLGVLAAEVSPHSAGRHVKFLFERSGYSHEVWRKVVREGARLALADPNAKMTAEQKADLAALIPPSRQSVSGETKDTQITFRCEVSFKKALERLADKTGEQVGIMLREALYDYLAKRGVRL